MLPLMSGETAERGLDLLLLDGLRCVKTTAFRSGHIQVQAARVVGGAVAPVGVALRATRSVVHLETRAQRGRVAFAALTMVQNLSEGFLA